MTLQSSGLITLSNIQSEFGGVNPISLSEYYRGGTYVPSQNTGVPTTGAISMGGNFYGEENTFFLTIASNTENANISTLATAAGWNGSTQIYVTINAGVWVWSDSTSTAGLIIPSGMPVVTILNNGYIIGKGGKGGQGQYISSKTEAASLMFGGAGGLAIQSRSNTIIINNSGAYIAGGGGGGAGGGDGGKGNGDTSGETVNGGVGGGINANGTNGVSKSDAQSEYGAGGGGGGSGGAGGGVGVNISSGGGVPNGSASGGGGGGGRKLPGVGGVTTGVSSGDQAFQGMPGGTAGAAGTNGSRQGGGGGGWGASSSGNGGTGGPAISGGYASLTNNGTVYGATA